MLNTYYEKHQKQRPSKYDQTIKKITKCEKYLCWILVGFGRLDETFDVSKEIQNLVLGPSFATRKHIDLANAFLGHSLESCVCFGFAVKLRAQLIKIVELLEECLVLLPAVEKDCGYQNRKCDMQNTHVCSHFRIHM